MEAGGAHCADDGGSFTILRLPTEVLELAIGKSTPRSACRCAAVSTAFRLAADSDNTWSSFLPPDIDSILSRAEDPPAAPLTKKEIFLSLSQRPVLLDAGTHGFGLDRESGRKLLMLSARALSIAWSKDTRYWRFGPHPDSRFREVAKLWSVCWLEIWGSVSCGMLSPSTTYAAYLVYKVEDQASGLDNPPPSVSIHPVSSSMDLLDVWTERPAASASHLVVLAPPHRNLLCTGVRLPRARDDGWLEVEMGEFNTGGDGGHENFFLRLFSDSSRWKHGLIVEGIDVRPKVTADGIRQPAHR